MTNKLKIKFCLNGLYKAIFNEWYDLPSFSIKKYEYCLKFENGNSSIIVPNKLICFASPSMF